MAETSHIIGPDEYLVMYTDGVTEEFSTAGEMFGDARVQCVVDETVRSYQARNKGNRPDAKTVLKAIDDAVLDFLDDDALADDLTLVVLKRLPGKSSS
jgi:serine phosphatase RsbU (regulator of sigma subunit)